jgi:hypothetical protein
VLPFSNEQFLAVFASYNEDIWPAQVIAYGAGTVALVAALARMREGAGRIVSWLVAGLWLWTGVAYHAFYFASINPAAHAFAALFVAQAALLLAYARRLQYSGPADLTAGAGMLFVGYAAVLYPLVGAGFGHVYPRVPVFGVTPCPVTLFTLGLLLIAARAPWSLFVIPVVWSLIGGSAAILLNVPQDWPLLIGGMLAVTLRWRQGRAAP